MAFLLKNNQSIQKNIRRIVSKQIDGARQELNSDSNEAEAVHDARKRFKKVRAVLRLVRDELGDKTYRRENTRFRDAGRPLTAVRDATVLIDALDNLIKHFADQITQGAFDPARRALQAQRKAIRKRVLKEENALATVLDAIKEARDRVAKLSINGRGWSALSDGLKRVYKQGYRAMTRATADPSVENLHEWRKQAKYLWHQVELLEPLWPGFMDELGKQVHELTQQLGDDHDLAILRQTVTANPKTFGGGTSLEALVGLIDRRRQELQQEAFLLGQRIYHDRPKVFLERIKGYWKAWRSEAKVPTNVSG